MALVGLVVLLVSWIGTAQAAAQEQPRFVAQAETVLVSFEVVAEGPDGPILGLTRDDFEVLHDGRRVDLTHFAAFTGAPAGHGSGGVAARTRGRPDCGPRAARGRARLLLRRQREPHAAQPHQGAQLRRAACPRHAARPRSRDARRVRAPAAGGDAVHLEPRPHRRGPRVPRRLRRPAGGGQRRALRAPGPLPPAQPPVARAIDRRRVGHHQDTELRDRAAEPAPAGDAGPSRRRDDARRIARPQACRLRLRRSAVVTRGRPVH